MATPVNRKDVPNEDRLKESDKNPADQKEGVVPHADHDESVPNVLPGGAKTLEEQGIKDPRM